LAFEYTYSDIRFLQPGSNDDLLIITLPEPKKIDHFLKNPILCQKDGQQVIKIGSLLSIKESQILQQLLSLIRDSAKKIMISQKMVFPRFKDNTLEIMLLTYSEWKQKKIQK
jgi:hypothetical protein